MRGAGRAACGAHARCGARAMRARNAWRGVRAARARSAWRGVRAIYNTLYLRLITNIHGYNIYIIYT